jgi:hypothetical protein
MAWQWPDQGHGGVAERNGAHAIGRKVAARLGRRQRLMLVMISRAEQVKSADLHFAAVGGRTRRKGAGRRVVEQPHQLVQPLRAITPKALGGGETAFTGVAARMGYRVVGVARRGGHHRVQPAAASGG